MGSKGFFHEIQRQRRLAAQEALRRERAIERDRKQAERAQAAYEKQLRLEYTQTRKAGVEALNRNLAQWIEQVTSILVEGVHYSPWIDLDADRTTPALPPLDLGQYAHPCPAPQWTAPSEPGRLSRMFGGEDKYLARVEEERARFDAAIMEHARQEQHRQEQVARLTAAHADEIARIEQRAAERNAVVDARAAGLEARNPPEVEWLAGRVLARTPLPDTFPRATEFAFDPRRELLAVRFELPGHDVIPSDREFKYIANKDEQRAVPRTKAQLDELYREVIAQTTLLCVRDLLGADPALHSVHFDGYVRQHNPATGEMDDPTIVSTSVERAQLPPDTNLMNVAPQVCLRSFDTLISGHPYEVEPIASTLDFDWNRYRFVKEFDAAATLDSRPDLMDMTPTQFEHLVRQIFQAQGAEGWTTQQSNDDGVDAVIAKRTPLIGGLAIVQAKQYRNVIGVNHVRELAGAMEEKKAGWGILITTSWFTTGCERKAREHGRMELIDGQQLVHLIEEHLHKRVLIGIQKRPRRRGPVAPQGPVVS
ncbi:restriction endonuclease [Nocardia sp. NPDC050175]|uniref:restriction endonuclease n=1 Tax=Nocardia sp. NPDC050175 TaxID=3364317 RepID=UPI0037A98C9A